MRCLTGADILIVGVGVDVLRIERIDPKLSRKILTDLEMKEFESRKNKMEYLAGRFALKEAFFKALGTGIDGNSFKDVEFITGSNGKPQMAVYKDFPVVFNFVHISLSHDFVVVALVVLEKVEGGIFVRGNIEDFQVINRNEEFLEVDSPFGPFKTKGIVERSQGELLRYGNVILRNPSQK